MPTEGILNNILFFTINDTAYYAHKQVRLSAEHPVS